MELKNKIVNVITENNLLGLASSEIEQLGVDLSECKNKAEWENWMKTLMLPDDTIKDLNLIKQWGMQHVKGKDVEEHAFLTKRKNFPNNIKIKQSKRTKQRENKTKSTTSNCENKWNSGLNREYKQCGCQGTKHKFQLNCLNCGRIICEVENPEECKTCHLPPAQCIAYELAIAQGHIDNNSLAKHKKQYKEALKRRDKLLQYAENSKINQVIDDQSSQNAQCIWLSKEESEILKMQEIENKNKVLNMHKASNANIMHIDFINKNISFGLQNLSNMHTDNVAIKEDKEINSDEMLINVKPKCSKNENFVEICSSNSFKSSEDKSNKYTNCNSRRIYPLPSLPSTISFYANTKICYKSYNSKPKQCHHSTSTIDRMQTDYFETAKSENLSDEIGELKEIALNSEVHKLSNLYAIDKYLNSVDHGVCLSVHQPYASLLIAGLRQHEGRSWYANYRGKLWIHATRFESKNEENIKNSKLSTLKAQTDQSPDFPVQYPTSCLLGYIYLVDCLTQEEYQGKYTEAEQSCNSPYVFICMSPKALQFNLEMKGGNKLYNINKRILKAAQTQSL